jgi:soluble lytic murein transglycosylase-like protein
VARSETGWIQQVISATGAVGIMQVEPTAAATAGPLLLSRATVPRNLEANGELGTAILPRGNTT